MGNWAENFLFEENTEEELWNDKEDMGTQSFSMKCDFLKITDHLFYCIIYIILLF